jgi:4,5-DOPA dioxygenase extradiol
MKMPAVFFGHGSPMLALEDNRYTQAWRDAAASIPRPKAIVAVSAHWYTRGTGVTAHERQKTVHDFYGFPQALFDVEYTPPGDPALAERVRGLLKPVDVHPDLSWGLDHGTWSVLMHAYPQADIPIIQLSIDATQPNAWHYEMGKKLAPLRDEGVLVAGFGNVVHNLQFMKRAPGSPPFDWAERFERTVKDALLAHDHDPLLHYDSLGEDARLSVPTPDHYLPLLYIAGVQDEEEPASILIDGIDMGSVSMLSAMVGTA